jgi:multisubunit Na+/H+ antiporter MnhF subunit
MAQQKGLMMDWQLINGMLSTFAAITLGRVVLHPDIHEGFVIKSGLITMIFALLGNAAHALTRTDDYEAVVKSYIAMVAGVCVVAFGCFLRVRGGKRRVSDIMGVHRGGTS